jgi:CheY-like chemotaxis protein
MPGMDGIALLKAVRDRFADIPFILFTGSGRKRSSGKAKRITGSSSRTCRTRLH